MESLYLSCTIAVLIVYLFTTANDDVTERASLEVLRLRMNILFRELKSISEAYKSKRNIIADYRDKRRTQDIIKERMSAEMNYDMAKEHFADTMISIQIDTD
jgi:hypothetical protein